VGIGLHLVHLELRHWSRRTITPPYPFDCTEPGLLRGMIGLVRSGTGMAFTPLPLMALSARPPVPLLLPDR
jgi:hypothetical protein